MPQDSFYLYRYHILSDQQSEWVDDIYQAITHLQNYLTQGHVPVTLHEYTYESEWCIENDVIYGEKRLFTLNSFPV
jgi:hypothetical protein